MWTTDLQNAMGWIFKGSKEQKKIEQGLSKNSYLDVSNDDGSQVLDFDVHRSQGAMLDDFDFKTQTEAINEYRSMSSHPIVNDALKDIVDGIVTTQDDDVPVKLDLDGVEISEDLKEKIADEFDYLIGLLNFNDTSFDKTQQWYTDGRLAVHLVVDEARMKDGIQNLVILDPRAVKPVIIVRRERDPKTGVMVVRSQEKYFVYNSAYAIDSTKGDGASSGYHRTLGVNGQSLKLSNESVVMCMTGVFDSRTGMALGPLESARKPLNNYRMMLDSMVIMRLTRAPDRRVFYVDTGTVPGTKANAMVKQVMDNNRMDIQYNATTGRVEGKAKVLAMHHDFWLPRREGSKGTEVQTLPGADNLNQIDDVRMFKGELYEALGVPKSRIEENANIVIGGARDGTVSRDEHKFQKYIQRLRKRYSYLFLEILRRHLILKGIVSEDEWNEEFKPNAKIMFTSDTYLKEQQRIEDFGAKVQALIVAKELQGVWFSQASIYKEIFGMDPEEIKEERRVIKQEIADGLYIDPVEREKQEIESQFPVEDDGPPKAPKKDD